VSDRVVYVKPDDVTDQDWAIYVARHRDGATGQEWAQSHGLGQVRVFTICRRVIFKVAEGFLSTYQPEDALRLAEWQVPISDAFRDEWLWLRKKREA
jgi:hypothetical protein